MSPRICASPDCQQPFIPDVEHAETQKYCSIRCGNRDRVRRHRERHKIKPGGGPGGNRQTRLFTRSELHGRKPSKAASVPKPKQDDLFPTDEGLGRNVFPEVREVLAYDGGAVVNTDDGILVIRPSAKLPTQAQPIANPEAPIAA